jgi:hypothetical protein
MYAIALVFLSASTSKDSLTIHCLEWRRSGGHEKSIRWCIPCSVPDSLRCQANYMFCNGYHLWFCSNTLCSHPRCKSTNVIRLTATPIAHHCLFYLSLQAFALRQLQASRAVSGRSVPIISCVALGAGAFIRFFGPESMGGAGDIGARTDAEVSRTGLSADEIGPKVQYLVSCF